MTFNRSSLVILAAAGLAASQSLSSLGLSQQCQDALSGSFANPEVSACLNVFTALNIFSTTANTSVVPAIDNWLHGVCAAAPCSNSTLSAAATNITTGCQSDLNSIGISSSDAQDIVNTVLPLYSTIRKVACLEDTKNSNILCVTEVLDDLQDAIGPLSVNNIISTAQGVFNGSEQISIPKNVTCNDCTEAAWAIIRQDVPSLASNTDVTNTISSQCGNDFVNASQPSEIAEASSTPSSGAALGSSISFKGFALAGVPLIGMLAGSALVL